MSHPFKVFSLILLPKFQIQEGRIIAIHIYVVWVGKVERTVQRTFMLGLGFFFPLMIPAFWLLHVRTDS